MDWVQKLDSIQTISRLGRLFSALVRNILPVGDSVSIAFNMDWVQKLDSIQTISRLGRLFSALVRNILPVGDSVSIAFNTQQIPNYCKWSLGWASRLVCFSEYAKQKANDNTRHRCHQHRFDNTSTILPDKDRRHLATIIAHFTCSACYNWW